MTDSAQEYRLQAEQEEALRWAASESDKALRRRRIEQQRPEEETRDES